MADNKFPLDIKDFMLMCGDRDRRSAFFMGACFACEQFSQLKGAFTPEGCDQAAALTLKIQDMAQNLVDD